MGLYSGGLIIGRICAPEIWGAYFQEGLFLEDYHQNFTVLPPLMARLPQVPCSSVVEHLDLSNQEVMGSTPVGRFLVFLCH